MVSIQPFDFLCIRHAQTDCNILGKIQGQDERPDTQLNSEGELQADATGKALAARYPEIATFYTSSLGRCLETVKRITHYFKTAKIIPKNDLKGVNHGLHDGMDFKLRNLLCEQYYRRVLRNFAEKNPNQTPDPFIKWKLNPLSGAETYYQVWERATKSLIEMASEISKQPSGKIAALVSNTVFIQALISRSEYEYKGDSTEPVPLFFELKKPLPNCVVVRFRYHPEEKFERKIQFIGFETFDKPGEKQSNPLTSKL